MIGPPSRPPPVLCTVDTGKRHAGVAIWVDGALVWSGVVRVRDAWRWSAAAMARAIVAEVDAHLGPLADLGAFAAESPRSYPGKGARERDLAALRAVVAALAVEARRRGGWLGAPTPSQWKGSIPKRITGLRVRAILTPEEAARVPWDEDDAVDAVGIGLWVLRRAGVGSVADPTC